MIILSLHIIRTQLECTLPRAKREKGLHQYLANPKLTLPTQDISYHTPVYSQYHSLFDSLTDQPSSSNFIILNLLE